MTISANLNLLAHIFTIVGDNSGNGITILRSVGGSIFINKGVVVPVRSVPIANTNFF